MTYDYGFLGYAAAAVDEALALDPDNIEVAYLKCDLLLAAEAYGGGALHAADALVASDPRDAMPICAPVHRGATELRSTR